MLFGNKKKKSAAPRKEPAYTTVPAQRFNDMIDYYTCELKSRLAEIDKLRLESQAIMNTAIHRSNERSDMEEKLKRMQNENETLKRRLRELSQNNNR